MSNFSASRSTTFPLPSSPHCAPRTITLFMFLRAQRTSPVRSLFLIAHNGLRLRAPPTFNRAQRPSPVRSSYLQSRTTDFACALLLPSIAHNGLRLCAPPTFNRAQRPSPTPSSYLQSRTTTSPV